MLNTKETYINLMGQHIDPSNAASLSDGIYFKMLGGEKTRMFLKGGEWSLPIAQTGNNEKIYNEHDEKYDYKNVDGVWMARLKTNAPDGEWFNFDSLDPSKKQKAEQSLNTAYPDALSVVDDANKNNTSGPDTSSIIDDSEGQNQGLQLNKDNLKFVSPTEGNVLSGMGDTNILDLVTAIDATYKDFKPENYYDPGSKEDYTKFTHKNTTNEDLYLDKEALEAGESTGNVLKDKSQLVDQQMQTILDERHERNPDKYAKVNNFESDIYGQTGYVNYDGKKQQGDVLEERYGDASFIGWSGDRDNYTTAFDYLKEDADGNQQPVDFPLAEMGPQTQEATMTKKPRDPLVLLNQMYGGSPHLQHKGDLYRAQGGFDFKGWMKGEQGFIPDYDGQSTKQTINENKTVNNVLDYTQTGLGAVGLQDYSGPVAIGADLLNSALSGTRAAIAPKGSEQRKMHTENAVLNATSAIPGYGLATGIASLTKDVANYSGVLDSNKSFGTQTGEFARNVIDNSSAPSFGNSNPIVNIAQNRNETPDAKDLAMDDTVEVDDEQSIGAWGLETPISTDPSYRTLHKYQMRGSTSNEQFPGYDPYSNIATPNNFQDTLFGSSAVDPQALANQNNTIEQTEAYSATQDELYAQSNKANELGFEGDLTKLQEYEDSENKQAINRDLRRDKLDEDNPNSSGTTGDKLWNAKNKALDSTGVQTYGKVGAGAVRIAKPVNRLLEQRRERKQLSTIQNNAYLSDNMFSTTDADLSGSKGDYDVNSGIFRAEDKITTRQGRYGTELTNQLYKAQNGFWDGVKNTVTYAAENLTPIGGAYQAANYAKDLYNGESLSTVGNNILDDTQSKLGVVGNIIGFGDIADGINAGVSVGRGYFSDDPNIQAQHYKNAAVSAESIINPVLGAASTLDDVTGGVTSLTDYAGVTPNVANYAMGTPSNTQASNTIFADNLEGQKERNLLRRGGSFFNDGGEAEIDINMYKELIAAGADLEII